MSGNAPPPDYASFLATKRKAAHPVGPIVDPGDVHPMLHDWQAEIVRWTVRQGRAAVFADCGLGKTFMQLEWARLIGRRVLILAPLSVARQTVREALKLDLVVTYVRHGEDVGDDDEGLWITNYEMVDRFNPAAFDAVVLDESSILKNVEGSIRKRLTEQFQHVPYRLACTATPAPNDVAELCNHAEFLGVMPRAEMLAAYFVHDEIGWRPKGHALGPMYEWMSTWSVALRKPSDVGWDDDGYDLPPLSIHPEIVDVDLEADGQLFATDLGGIGGRSKVRRATMDARVERAASLARRPGQWIVWCGLNDEASRVAEMVGHDAVNVEGSWSPDDKAEALEAFQDGVVRVLVTKPSIAGFGMNFQQCHQMVFLGLSDSYEAYYQAIRRCYRFGQQHPVDAHVVVSGLERQIVDNVQRKEIEAGHTADALVHYSPIRRSRQMTTAHQPYITDAAQGECWRLLLGDSCERLAEIPSDSVDLAIYSPPFASLYTYSPSDRDLGNSATTDEFIAHYRFVLDHMCRITKPGRTNAVHVQQVAILKSRDGYVGLQDFRGRVIQAHLDAGFIYYGEVTVDKNPQLQAVRTKAQGLMFVQLRRDAAMSRPALADYVLIFHKPGENEVPIQPDISNETWIEWASPVWYGIAEMSTLNPGSGSEDADERHICPLQLPLIERAVRLWSNPGEIVCSPFAGIGSEGYVSILNHRRFIGCELKPSYWQTACANLAKAEAEASTPTLFDAPTTDRPPA